MDLTIWGKIITILELFDKWLEEVSKEQNLTKDDVQILIKAALQDN